MVIKVDKLAAYVVMAFAAFQSWYAGVLDMRPEEAYYALKALGTSWSADPHGGLIDYIALLTVWFSPDLPALRISSVLMMSFAAVFVFKSAFMLGGRTAAWTSLFVFLVSPAVNTVYTFLSPAAALTLFSAVAYYSWLRAFHEGSSAHFAIAGFFSGVCLFTHTLGVAVFASAIFYMLIFDRNRIMSREFVWSLVVFLFFLAVLFLLGMSGYNILPGYSGTPHSGGYEYIIVGFLCSPAVFYAVPSMILMRGRLQAGGAFLSAALVVSLFIYVAAFMVGGFDINLCAALFLPAVMLCGYLFSEVGGKVFLGALLLCSALLSAYIKIAPNLGMYLPSEFVGGGEVYKSFADPIARGLPRGGAVFADDSGTASLLSFYINPHPQACISNDCGVDYGLYITSIKADDQPEKPFHYMKLYGMYRIIDRGISQEFYLYTVR